MGCSTAVRAVAMEEIRDRGEAIYNVEIIWKKSCISNSNTCTVTVEHDAKVTRIATRTASRKLSRPSFHLPGQDLDEFVPDTCRDRRSRWCCCAALGVGHGNLGRDFKRIDRRLARSRWRRSILIARPGTCTCTVGY